MCGSESVTAVWAGPLGQEPTLTRAHDHPRNETRTCFRPWSTEPIGCRRPVEHRPAIPVELLGQVVDLGARGGTLETGNPQFEEASEH
jgi:hypothetical protein